MSCMEPRERQAQAKSCTSIAKISTKNQNRRKAMSELQKIIIRAVHKYKDSREQFEQRTHKRLIDVTNATNKTVEALQKLDAPAGVDIYVKL